MPITGRIIQYIDVFQAFSPPPGLDIDKAWSCWRRWAALFPRSQQRSPGLAALSQQWWMPGPLWSSQRSARRDQLQASRHHKRPAPPPHLCRYHNDLSGAIGRGLDAMIRSPLSCWRQHVEEHAGLTLTTDNLGCSLEDTKWNMDLWENALRISLHLFLLSG